ncbi:tRNA-(ms[2]io[6]A)-hydroxylase [Seongchinamella sediminis]|uniref:tRNA-(Ms[2]io[6]A)-hydroxylase n=1 Tax=Seongchinamella sediminis TaxID=2283635 RepID=A0A3L7E3L1_9GAMM|nr:tRNA isopentenyl-2-thiomethyl-A-37 hydroxylase MiaE [Seongchinamella sediminis]RLQ22902.1 tRNA-(ms[2]io[6]A)-hydroxylase [Seongchinamella sediminis]
MTTAVDISPILDFLACPTPRAWVDWALENPEILLVDHANCEKKAASTALNLMYRYVEHYRLLNKLSRLAREELRHFEQVIAIMKKRKVAYPQIAAARYAGELRKPVRTHEPGKLVDTLIVGAIIEARSCERFACIAPELDGELAGFYRSLLKSESRHFADYLALAEEAGSADEVAQRLPLFLQLERQLIESPDSEFRFHSGVPG